MFWVVPKTRFKFSKASIKARHDLTSAERRGYRRGVEDAAAKCVPYFTIPVVDAELDCDAKRIFLEISALIEAKPKVEK